MTVQPNVAVPPPEKVWYQGTEELTPRGLAPRGVCHFGRQPVDKLWAECGQPVSSTMMQPTQQQRRGGGGPPRRFEPPIVAGRVPPHDLDAEAAVLSAILLSREALDRVLEILKPEQFYSDANGRIYEAAVGARARGDAHRHRVGRILPARPGAARADRRAELPGPARRRDAGGGPRGRARAGRLREVEDARPHRDVPARRGRGLRRRGGGAGVHRRRRAVHLRARPHRAAEQRPADQPGPPRRLPADHGGGRARRPHHRHLHGVREARRQDRGPPRGRPDDRRRAPWHGEDLVRPQPRRERGVAAHRGPAGPGRVRRRHRAAGARLRRLRLLPRDAARAARRPYGLLRGARRRRQGPPGHTSSPTTGAG